VDHRRDVHVRVRLGDLALEDGVGAVVLVRVGGHYLPPCDSALDALLSVIRPTSSMPLARSSSIASMTALYGASSTPLSQTVLSALMPSTVWSCVSGLDALLVAMGSLTSTPFCSSGAMIIMMMRSTSMTSTRGVTLMSDLTPPPPPSCIAIVTTPLDS